MRIKPAFINIPRDSVFASRLLEALYCKAFAAKIDAVVVSNVLGVEAAWGPAEAYMQEPDWGIGIKDRERPGIEIRLSGVSRNEWERPEKCFAQAIAALVDLVRHEVEAIFPAEGQPCQVYPVLMLDEPASREPQGPKTTLMEGPAAWVAGMLVEKG